MIVAGFLTDTALFDPDLDSIQLTPGNRYKVTTTTSEFTGVLTGVATNLNRTTTAQFVPFDASWTGRPRKVVLSEITQIERLN